MGNMSFIYTRDGSRTFDWTSKRVARPPEHVGMKTYYGRFFEMRNYWVVNKNG